MAPLNTSVHRGGHQFIAMNPKLELRRCVPTFCSKRFINHSIIIKELRNMPGTHCYVPQCINSGNNHVINDHLRAKNSCVSRAIDTFCDTSSPRYELKSKLNLFFFVILWLFDFSALLLLLVFASSGCLIYTFMSTHTRNYARCYELMR